MKSQPHIVYLSVDGLLEPLGYSQVARVVKGLARSGRYRMTILSLERPVDLSDNNREEVLEAELHELGIRWQRAPYSSGGGPLDAARNVRAMGALLRAEMATAGGVDLIHARSYIAASVARTVGGKGGVPYLFDIRGYWVDERIEQGRWFVGPVRERAARRWERSLYENAAGIVSLTELAAEDIRNQRLSPWDTGKPLMVIPTCVDYGEFGLGGPGSAEGISQELAAKLQSKLVVGFVGAVQQAYCVEESLRLFEHVRARRPDAHLLCLTRNPPALLEYLEKMGLDPESYTVTTATHSEMPAWLSYMDWGLLLRRTEPSHRAAMPTKLAEFFASGVRPIQWGCNEEVRHWVRRAGSGVVLDRLDEADLRAAADEIATWPRGDDDLLSARWRTRGHYGLQEGIRRYEQIYERLLSPTKPKLRVLFLTEGTTVPASRFRVEQFLPHLKERGIECTVRPAYGDKYNRMSRAKIAPVYKLACSLQRLPYLYDADDYDLVFLQRPALPFSALPERLANWRNPRTIFDVDDAIFVDADGRTNALQMRAFEEVVSSCAHIVCGNDYLAEKTSHLTPTTVIPTVVDTERYRPGLPREEHRDKIVIGWMGTSSNFVSLKIIAPLLKRLAETDERVLVRIVSNQRFAPLEGVKNVEQILWSADQEIRLLQSFDIGLMPLRDNLSTRGKCGFKAIQYMAVGVPVVASAVGANKEILDDQSGGLLARTVTDFESALKRLIADEELRERMGKEGREHVERNYSINAVIDRYVRLFEAVAGRVSMPEIEIEEAGEQTREGPQALTP